MEPKLNPKAYETFQEMNQEDWRSLNRELLAYTVNLVSKKYWRHGVLPKGYTEEDIVQTIITKTLTGERNWNPAAVDLKGFLLGQVRSIVSHMFESKEYKRETHIDDIDTDITEIIDKKKNHEEWNDNPFTRSPGELILLSEHKEEQESIAKIKVDAILEACNGKEDLSIIFEAGYELLEDGQNVNCRNIARKLDIPREEIYKRVKRLNRLKDKLEKELYQSKEVIK